MKYIYTLLSVILIFSACNKDSVLINKKVDISPPEVIDGAVVKGMISSNSGEILEGVSIEIYQNDQKIGKVYSDDKGNYSTQSVTIKPDSPVTLKYDKENFEKKYRRYDFEENIIQKKDLIMGIKSDSSNVNKEEFDLVNPTDTNLIKLYGYAKLADGTPVAGVNCSAVWKYHISGGKYSALWVRKHISDFTDEDGYFEVLVPKREIVHFIAYKTRYPGRLIGSCGVSFSDENPTGKLSDWHYMEIGSFTEDFEVDLRNDIVFETLRTTVIGKVVRCDGTPVMIGDLRVSLIYDSWFTLTSEVIKNYSFGQNGEFEVYLETCPFPNKTENYYVKVSVIDSSVNFSGFEQVDFNENIDFGEVKLCVDNRDFPDEFELTIESVTRIYPEGGDYTQSGLDKLQTGFYYKDGNYREDVYLATDIVELGVVPIRRFKMCKGIKRDNENVVDIYETTFDAKPEDVTMTITKIEDHYVYGNIVGNVETPRGRKPVSATFKIYNK